MNALFLFRHVDTVNKMKKPHIYIKIHHLRMLLWPHYLIQSMSRFISKGEIEGSHKSKKLIKVSSK